MSLTLIGGGARSGKSRHALELARAYGPHLAFVATAEAGDEEMRERIARHKQERAAEFTTFEEPREVAACIAAQGACFDAMIVDCLTLWASNLLLARVANVEERGRELVANAVNAPARVLLVTNEVGCGIVPENALAREFRDLAGKLNQEAARAADEVYWMAFGIPLKVK